MRLAGAIAILALAAATEADPPRDLGSPAEQRRALVAAGIDVAPASLRALLDQPEDSAPAPAGAIAEAVRNLGHARYAVRERATAELVAIGPPARPALEAALGDLDLERRVRARALLEHIAATTSHLRTALLLLSTDRDVRSRAVVLRVVRRYPELVARPLVDALVDRLAGEPVEVAWLREQLAAPCAPILAAVLRMMLRYPRDASAELPALEPLLAHADDDVRLWATAAMSHWRPEAMLGPLVAFLDDPSPERREVAGAILDELLGERAGEGVSFDPKVSPEEPRPIVDAWRLAVARWHGDGESEVDRLLACQETAAYGSPLPARVLAMDATGTMLAQCLVRESPVRPGRVELASTLVWCVKGASPWQAMGSDADRYNPVPTCLAFGPDRRLLWVGQYYGAHLVDLLHVPPRSVGLARSTNRPAAIACSPDAQRVLVLDAVGGVELFGRDVVPRSSDRFGPLPLVCASAARARPMRFAAVAFGGLDQPFAARATADAVWVMNVITGEERHGGLPPDPRRSLLALAPDGTRVAVLARDGWIHVHDVPTGKSLAFRPARRPAVLALSTAGAWLAAGADARDGGGIEVWEVGGKRQWSARTAHPDGVVALAFARDGERLAVAGSASPTTLWDTSGTLLYPAPRVHRGVLSLTWLADARLASLDSHGVLATWNVSTDGRRFELEARREHPSLADAIPRRLVRGPRESLVVVAPNRVDLLDLRDGQAIVRAPLDLSRRRVDDVAILPGTRTALLGIDGGVESLDLASGRRALLDLGARVDSFAVSPTGTRVAMLVPGTGLVIRDLRTGTTWVAVRAAQQPSEPFVWADDKRLVVAIGSGLAAVDVESSAVRSRLDLADSCPWTALAITPDGRNAVAGNAKSRLAFWSLEAGSGAPTTRLMPRGPIETLAVRPDGQVVAVATASGELQLWAVTRAR